MKRNNTVISSFFSCCTELYLHEQCFSSYCVEWCTQVSCECSFRSCFRSFSSSEPSCATTRVSNKRTIFFYFPLFSSELFAASWLCGPKEAADHFSEPLVFSPLLFKYCYHSVHPLGTNFCVIFDSGTYRLVGFFSSKREWILLQITRLTVKYNNVPFSPKSF